MKFPPRVIAVALLASLLGSCDTTEVRKAMVHFDRAFVPVLVYSCQGDIHQAKRAVFYLEFQWQKLQKKYEGCLPEEAETLNRINDWLGDAYYAIDANCPATAANQLEHVKYEFMELRRRYGLEYYLDGLYDFQNSIGLLAEAGGDELMCRMEWEEYEHLLNTARAEWKAIQEKPFDAALYEFDDKRLQQLRSEQKAMEEVLDQFAEIFSCANRQELARASRNLQPAFFEVLKVFGNFENSQTYFAQM